MYIHVYQVYCTYMYSWVQFKPCQHQKLNPEKNIYFHMLPSIPLEIAHQDTSKSGESKTLYASLKSYKIQNL
jgi:hypothetical protein